MPHICMDEILLFMAMLPFVSSFFIKIHQWWHIKFQHKCHHKGCIVEHSEHKDQDGI